MCKFCSKIFQEPEEKNLIEKIRQKYLQEQKPDQTPEPENSLRLSVAEVDLSNVK